jgi:hypothetical protein
MTHTTLLPHTQRVSQANSRGPTARGGLDRGDSNDRGPLAPGYCLWNTTASLAGFLTVLFVLSGCGKGSETPSDGPVKPARSQVERGPVRVTVEVKPAKASLSDEPVLTLTIDSEEGVAVQKPPFGSTLGGFTIRNFREPLPKTSNGREVIQQIYTLDPTEPGRLRIDPIAVTFTDRRPRGDGRTHTIETEPITVEVSSLVGDKAPSLGDLRPPAEPIEIPSHVAIWLWSLVPIAAAVAVALWWLSRRRRGTKVANAVVLSPEQLANRELDELVASGLAERDIKEFYVELTSIVRRYIERTTGIRAPEQTTEEFLREISRAHTFGDDECSRLRNFLESADLVKFAAHQPRSDDIAESIRRARLFVSVNPKTTTR